MREAEKLEQRLALSVTVVERENLSEVNFSNQVQGTHPGQLLVASDQGSDVFLQKIDMTPTELLVADNGSFLDYMAYENVEDNFAEFIVTNGSRHQQQESITADSWWLFPTKTNDNAVSVTEDEASTENLTTTRLALDRPEIVIGPYTENSGTGAENGSGGWYGGNATAVFIPVGNFLVVGTGQTAVTVTGADFFGSVSYLQSDGTVSKWTYSAWDGLGNTGADYVREFGEALYITSGPGYGGGPVSYKETSYSKPEGLPDGYVFPRKISVVTEQLPENLQPGPANTKQFGGRRHYLEVEWSQVPVTPPVLEANYWGCSHYDPQTNIPQNVRDPFSQREDVPPTVGVAARTSHLDITIPRAVTEGSVDGSPTLGIIPGTTSGTLVLGGDGQEDVFEVKFEDRKNIFPSEDQRLAIGISDQENDGYTFFFDEIGNSGSTVAQRQFGVIEAEIETNIVKDIDWRFREQGLTQTYLEGGIADATSLRFSIGSHLAGTLKNQLYGDNSSNNAFRALEGINVVINENNLLDGTARNAVRVRDLDYHVYVKPTVTNEVYFVAGGDITRSVTVDLLTEGSSLYVNSPIRVEEAGGDLDIRATNVIVNAPMETPDYLILGRSNSDAQPRLPRLSDPQGGEKSTPTFTGSLLSDESTTRTVVPTPVLKGRSVETLEVLPGREGYGYDPTNPPTVTISPALVQDAEVIVTQIAGGVSEVILDAGGSYTGTGVNNGTEYMPITFDEPQLQIVESVHRWTQINPADGGPVEAVPPPSGYGATPVIAISQPDIIRSSARIGYGKRAVVSADSSFGNGVAGGRIADPGDNYSAKPNINFVSRNPARDMFDPRVDPSLWSRPTFDCDFEILFNTTTTGVGDDAATTATYRGHRLSNFRVVNPGFGLNISSNQDLEDFYTFNVTGGHNGNARTPDGTVIQNIPPQNEITHAEFKLDAALGTLAWKGNSPSDNVNTIIRDENGIIIFENNDALLSGGLHYETSPDVQFIGSLSAEVALEFYVDEDSDGSDGIDENDTPNDDTDDIEVGDPVVINHTNPNNPADPLTGVFTATVGDVRAFADGTDRFPQQKLRFRDIDYLSYLNSQPDGYISAFVSSDNINWQRVIPVKKDAIANFEHSIWGRSDTSSQSLVGNDDKFYLDDPGHSGEDDFNKWDSLRVGMRLVIPLQGGTSHETTVAAWDQLEKTITFNDPIPLGQTVPATTSVRFDDAEVMLDEDTQQFSFRKVRYDGLDGKYSGSLFEAFNETEDEFNGLLTGAARANALLEDTKYIRFFFDPWFENNQIDAECRAYATMTNDPAQGRAVVSNGTIVLVEVTYPGSGYIQTPGVTFGGQNVDPLNTAAGRAIVEGGIFEMKLTEGGFNYQGDDRPGLNSTSTLR